MAKWGGVGAEVKALLATLTDARRGGHSHTVVVRGGADGGLQTVEVAVLIDAGEAHQRVGCRRGDTLVTPASCQRKPPVGLQACPCTQQWAFAEQLLHVRL